MAILQFDKLAPLSDILAHLAEKGMVWIEGRTASSEDEVKTVLQQLNAPPAVEAVVSAVAPVVESAVLDALKAQVAALENRAEDLETKIGDATGISLGEGETYADLIKHYEDMIGDAAGIELTEGQTYADLIRDLKDDVAAGVDQVTKLEAMIGDASAVTLQPGDTLAGLIGSLTAQLTALQASAAPSADGSTKSGK